MALHQPIQPLVNVHAGIIFLSMDIEPELRPPRLVRPVTARYMHAKEIAAYEKADFEKESATPENQ